MDLKGKIEKLDITQKGQDAVVVIQIRGIVHRSESDKILKAFIADNVAATVEIGEAAFGKQIVVKLGDA